MNTYIMPDSVKSVMRGYYNNNNGWTYVHDSGTSIDIDAINSSFRDYKPLDYNPFQEGEVFRNPYLESKDYRYRQQVENCERNRQYREQQMLEQQQLQQQMMQQQQMIQMQMIQQQQFQMLQMQMQQQYYQQMLEDTKYMQYQNEYYDYVMEQRKVRNDNTYQPSREEIDRFNADMEMKKFIEQEKVKLTAIFDEKDSRLYTAPNLDSEQKYQIYQQKRNQKQAYCKQQMEILKQQGISDYNQELYDLYKMEYIGRDLYDLLHDGNEHIIATDTGFIQYPNKKPLEEVEFVDIWGNKRKEVPFKPVDLTGRVNTGPIHHINKDRNIPSFAGRRQPMNSYYDPYYGNNYYYNEQRRKEEAERKKAMDIISRSCRRSLGISDEEYRERQQEQKRIEQEQMRRKRELDQIQELNRLDASIRDEDYIDQDCIRYNTFVANEQEKTRSECPLDSSVFDWFKYLTKEGVRMKQMNMRKTQQQRLYNSQSYNSRLNRDTNSNNFGRAKNVPIQYNKNIEFEDGALDQTVTKLLHELNNRPAFKREINGVTIEEDKANGVLNITGAPGDYLKRREEFLKQARMKNTKGIH